MMDRRVAAAGCSLLACAAAWGPTPTQTPPPAGPSLTPQELMEDQRELVAQARDRVFPALVNIRVITLEYSEGQERKGGSTGSGSIISPEGYVLTNQHVTSHGTAFRCTLADKQEVDAQMVGEDPLTDLAVLKLDLAQLKPGGPLPVAQMGDSETLQVGDTVMAMGSPLSLSRSVTLGIVSNPSRVFTSGFGGEELDETTLDDGQLTGTFTRWIQHDALINPGNSGGPLVNLKGEIVGVNELGGRGIGFAIPANLAREVAAALVKHGEVPRSFVGLSFRSISRTGIEKGVLISSVIKDGPAARAGVQAGDVLVALDGKPITVRFAEEIPSLLKRFADAPIGSMVKLTLDRRGQEVNASITTEKLLKDVGDQAALRGWGISVEEITEPMAREMRLTRPGGVLITGVRPGSPAEMAEPRIEDGDVLREVDGTPVTNLKGVVELYRKLMVPDHIPERLVLRFDREAKDYATLIKPRPEKPEDPPREVPKAWLGVVTQPVLRDLAKQMGHEGQLGHRVTRVYPGTMAQQAGLQVGDVITALNGEKLSPKGMQDAGQLLRRVRALGLSDTATLRVLRQGKETELSVTMEQSRLAPEEARHEQNKDFELTVRELTFFDRDRERWGEEVKGVLVISAERVGWAGMAGVRPGDLIMRVADTEVTDIESYRAVVEKLTKEQPPRVVFVVLRGTRTYFQFAEPRWKPQTKEEAKENKDAPPAR